ncbi:MAG: ABC transporter permease subunit [Planctomycetota bacterium]
MASFADTSPGGRLTFLSGIIDGLGGGATEDLTQAEEYRRIASVGIVFMLVQLQSLFVLPITSVVGSGLIAKDVRSNALEVYLTKPMTRADYVVGKLAVIACFVFLATFAPVTAVWGIAASLLEGFAGATWDFVPRVLLACGLVSLVNGCVILGLSSLARSGRYATVIWFALCFFSFGTAQTLVAVTGNPVFSLVSYRDGFAQLVSRLMEVDGLPEILIARDVPFVATVLVLAGYVLLSLAIMRRTIEAVAAR